HKRIVFNSARNCSYDLLKKKVEECFSLYGALYTISYKDDDGEITNIATDVDLVEAIQYFQAGDDAPMSSAASILSGRSFGPRKITLRVNIMVDYDGPSLSDTSSLASIEEFKGRNGSQLSFSYGTPNAELDDDSVTVSSRDPGTSSSRNGKSFGSWSFASSDHRGKSSSGKLTNDRTQKEMRPGDSASRNGPTSTFRDQELAASTAERFPADPSAVFERLKHSETLHDDTSSINTDSLAANERGAAWLRDQNERTIRSMLGALPEPSISDDRSFSLESHSDSLGGDLALERDTRGKYYYTYTSGSASQFHGSVADEEAQSGNGDVDIHPSLSMRGPRPTSMQLKWLAAHRVDQPKTHLLESDLQSISIPEEPATELPYSTIDKDLLPFLPVTAPEQVTDCSNCGILLGAIRYICSTCGPKEPIHSFAPEKGKEKDSSPVSSYTYPPPSHSGHHLFSSPNSSSSQTYVASLDTDTQRYKPLPSVPSSSFPSLGSLFGGSGTHLNIPSSPSKPSPSLGYELCSACLDSVGINHAVEGGLAAPGSSPIVSNMSPHDDSDQASKWRRSAPKKGQLRHAFKEKVWGHYGWVDVVLDEALINTCSTCSAVTDDKRYKCASCSKIHLCKACYRQVHETHPLHAFLTVPDKPKPTDDDTLVASDYDPIMMRNPHEELSLTHQGAKCTHCLREIVGALFRCAICPSVDICSNCESAGLPGNLDSADGGHTSSHILVKFPYPLQNSELEIASKRAAELWMGRDAANVGFPVARSKAESELSFAHTMIVNGSRSNRDGRSNTSDRVVCNHCNDLITGVRYQCAHCPADKNPSSGYNLCSSCEPESYLVHNPLHIFFKLPRPVQRPLEFQRPWLPLLYKVPVGPGPNAPRSHDPKAYLASLVHTAAVCDRCMERIEGEWFRCAYCNLDLCDSCEAVDTHDNKHIFLVFKAPVDMYIFKNLVNLENPANGSAVIPYAVYF
ncbi:hypothetical protein BDN70DRAFT_983489, partial [Pholiota conissans]